MSLTLLFDADDTLWENNVHFERIAAQFHAWLAHPDPARAQAVHREVESLNVARHGYGTAVFVRTLHDCAERLREREPTAAERAEVDAMAAALTWEQVELVDGVEDVLTALGARHELRLVTKGDPVEQQRKIDASGLVRHFAGVHIVATKTPQTYRDLVVTTGLDPAATWMIGNSPRSDVLAPRAAGLGAVLVPHAHTWAHEDAVVDDPAVLHVPTLRGLLQHF